MSVKRAIRRRSNWYIYLLSFTICSAILSFVIWKIWDMLFPVMEMPTVSRSGVSDYRPDASHNATVLFMLSEDKGAVPDYYLLINYRPRDDTAIIIPIKESLASTVSSTTGNLTDIYKSGGASAVMYAINNSLGIEVDNYIKFDKGSFVDFFNLIGETPMNIPEDTIVNNEKLIAGLHYFNGQSLYDYITYDGFKQGNDYTHLLHGSAVTSFINTNMRNLTVIEMQNIFKKMINSTDTDLDFTSFTTHQSAYLYTTQNSYNIAEYYIPYGEYNENGNFIIADSSLTTIKDRFGLLDE